jgi:hypothetical protein
VKVLINTCTSLLPDMQTTWAYPEYLVWTTGNCVLLLYGNWSWKERLSNPLTRHGHVQSKLQLLYSL